MPQTETNKALVTQIFAELAAGNHRALLSRTAENSHWTVTGTCPVAGQFHSRKDFYEKVLSRITAELTGKVHPTVIRVLGDGDYVVIEWRGDAVSHTGMPYRNHYCWVLRIADGLVQEGTIYSDTALVSALLAD